MAIETLNPEKAKSDDSKVRQTAPPHLESGDISVLDILIAIFERKLLVISVTSAFVALSVLYALIAPASYTATAIVLPPRQDSSSTALSAQLGGAAALAGINLNTKSPNDMFVAMFRTRTVEDAMVSSFGLEKEYRVRHFSDARNIFEMHSNVDGTGKDGLIRVSVKDRDPHRAAELVNGYVEQFRILSQHLAFSEASQRRLFFEGELERAKNNLSDAEVALMKTEQETGVFALDNQAQALIAAAANLHAQITEKEVQIQTMQLYATNQNEQLIQTQRELDALRTQLSKLQGNYSGSNDELILPRGRVTASSLEYVRKLRDVKYYETIFNILARQFENAKLDEAKQGAIIQVVDPAIAPERRSAPRRVLIVSVASVVGFIFGIGIALLISWYRNVNMDPEVTTKFRELRKSVSF